LSVEEQLSNYIYLSKYSRWRDTLKRRECWEETVDRYITFFQGHLGLAEVDEILEELRGAILNKEVVPSMRSLMVAGKALERDHAASYNCAAIAITHPRCFDEIFYLLMCG